MKDIALKSLLLAGISVGISLSAYFGWFFVALDLPLSKSPEVWGQFGSYMAGTVGVSMALATVWMLADTLKLQREELGLTRRELELTREEMQRTTEAHVKQAKINKSSHNIQRNYYYIKSIEDNLNKIYQKLDLFIDENGFEDTFFMHIKNQMDAKAFTDQYMLLIQATNNQNNEEDKLNIHMLINPIKYRHRIIVNLLYDAGFFEKYNKSLLSDVFIDRHLNDLDFEDD
ncbi:hypothetical protein ACGK9R_16585 [Halomonas sp. HNIBRBA4712]|uniref:hypothetical protein n=1 Tax=Halomonas sp. HNIBRBA4712 TaxID=3373087 RepID=UPI003745970A